MSNQQLFARLFRAENVYFLVRDRDLDAGVIKWASPLLSSEIGESPPRIISITEQDFNDDLKNCVEKLEGFGGQLLQECREKKS